MPDLNPYRKAIVPVLAAALVGGLELVGVDVTDSTAANLVVAVLTALGVFGVPNEPQRERAQRAR